MQIKELLKKLDFSVYKDELSLIKIKVDEFIDFLEKAIQKEKIVAEVFVGGSFAKETLVKNSSYDIDIFVRFESGERDISALLNKILDKYLKMKKLKFELVHGSRDYFRIKKENIVFEIIPVKKIKNIKEAENITDLSYFHVKYVKNKIKKRNLTKEVIFAKKFCKAHGVYGAESYINGFSGYGLECLIANFGSFEKMIRALVKVKDKLVIDSEKKYKNKKDIFIELNESKLKSPIILIDPTCKERNALSALNKETFEKFKAAANAFLNKPNQSFFEIKKPRKKEFENLAKQKNLEFINILLKTNKQPGDIAGTKLNKFANFLIRELSQYFNVIKKEFNYSEGTEAELYLLSSSKGQILKKGPQINLKNNVAAFKKKHKNTFEKMGRVYARDKVGLKAKEFIKKFNQQQTEKIREMDICELRVT